jgi:hypothetical protein
MNLGAKSAKMSFEEKYSIPENVLALTNEVLTGLGPKKSQDIVDSSCKKPLVICNSIFSIFLNQIKAQRDQKIIVWIEYFPYKYSFKVISND